MIFCFLPSKTIQKTINNEYDGGVFLYAILDAEAGQATYASDRSPCSLDMVDTCHPIVTGSHWEMALPSAYPK